MRWLLFVGLLARCMLFVADGLLLGACCVFFAVRCLFFADVRRLLFRASCVIRCLSFASIVVVCCLLFVVCCLFLSIVVRCVWFVAVCCFVIRCSVFDVRCVLFAVCFVMWCLLFVVCCSSFVPVV